MNQADHFFPSTRFLFLSLRERTPDPQSFPVIA
jgi:hypothetical protein